MHRKSRKPRRLPTEAGNVSNKKEEKKESHNQWKTRSEIRYARHLEYIRNLTRQDQAETNAVSIDECLPGELLVLIFSFLDIPTVSKLMFVSTSWLAFAKHNALWKPIVQEKFGNHVARYSEEDKEWFEVCKRLHYWHWDSKVHSCVKLSQRNLRAKNTVVSVKNANRKDKQTRMVLRVAGHIDSGIHHFSLTILKCKKANIGFGLANRNIACSTITRGFNENNNGIGYYSVGGMFATEGMVHMPEVQIPKYGEGDVISMLVDMEENVIRFMKWTDHNGETFSFTSSKIRIKRNPREAMHVVCLVKGTAKVGIECCPLSSVLDKL